MANDDITLSLEEATKIIIAMNAVERLPILTDGIIKGVNNGEAYEVLCRQIRVLHQNLVEISAMAVAAKTCKTREAA